MRFGLTRERKSVFVDCAPIPFCLKAQRGCSIFWTPTQDVGLKHATLLGLLAVGRHRQERVVTSLWATGSVRKRRHPAQKQTRGFGRIAAERPFVEGHIQA